ncbi:MAG: protein kinase, partial [Rubripirellula sp.]
SGTNGSDEEYSPDQVTIRVVRGPNKGLSWTFDRETRMVIGRQAPSQLKLPDEPAMSREHVALEIQPPHAYVSDLDSSNGTMVNGVRIKSAALSHGDQFGVGETLFKVEVISTPPRSHSRKQASQCLESDTLSVDQNGSPAVEEFEHTRATSVPIQNVSSNANSDEKSSVAREVQQPADTLPPFQNEDSLFSAATEANSDHASDNTDTNIRLGSYQLVRLLGHGGMATVHLARHLRTEETVAIKLIRSDSPITNKQIRLFVREAGVLTKLQHPRIVKAIEFGLEETRLYLVMEYIKTVDLFSLLDQQTSKQRTKIATWIVTCILQAVHYAHEQGIVHRDIKPGNLLAYREGRHLRVKLADFGLAKCYEDAGLSQMTSERSMRGTLAYMAPEQFENARDSGPSVDLFSCGACLYGLMTGVLPAIMTNREETMAVLNESQKVPNSLKPVIAKAIAIDPKDRYPTPNAFATELYKFHRRKC